MTDDEKQTFLRMWQEFSLKDLAVAMIDTRAAHKEAKDAATAIWKEYELLTQVCVVERMESMDITSAKIPGVGTLGIGDNLYASVPKEDKDAMQEWLRHNGYGDLIQGTVNSSTLSAQVRKWIKDGDSWPDDLIKLNVYQQAKITA